MIFYENMKQLNYDATIEKIRFFATQLSMPNSDIPRLFKNLEIVFLGKVKSRILICAQRDNYSLCLPDICHSMYV